MKRIFLVLVSLFLGMNAFSFDNYAQVIERISGYENTKKVNVEVDGDTVILKTPRGSSKAVYSREDGTLVSLTVAHYFKYDVDKDLMREHMKLISYIVGEPELNESRLSDEDGENYSMEMSAGLSGYGAATKILDVLLVSKEYLWLNGGREQKITIKINRK